MACIYKHRPWSVVDINRLVRLRSAGLSYVDISGGLRRTPRALRVMFNRQPAAVRAAVAESRRLFFKQRRPELQRQRRRKQAAELRAQGLIGGPKQSWTPSDRECLFKLLASGMSWAAIAQTLGRSEKSVISQGYWRQYHDENKARGRERRKNRLPFTGRSGHWTADEIDYLLSELAAGQSPTEIARLLNREQSATFRKIFSLTKPKEATARRHRYWMVKDAAARAVCYAKRREYHKRNPERSRAWKIAGKVRAQERYYDYQMIRTMLKIQEKMKMAVIKTMETDPKVMARFRALNDNDLRETFKRLMARTVEAIVETAQCILVLDEREIDMSDVKTSWYRLCYSVAYGKAVPELILAAPSPTMFNRLGALPVADQRRIVENKSFKVAVSRDREGKIDHRLSTFTDMTKVEKNRVFGSGSVRSLEEQLRFEEEKKQARPAKMTVSVELTPAEFNKLSRKAKGKKMSPDELIKFALESQDYI